MNLIKGWVTSIIGFIIMVADVLFFFGVINLPEPNFIPKPIEVGVAFLVGLALFVMPKTKIEEFLSRFINKIIDKE